MEQNDASGIDPGGDPAIDGICVVVLPIQTVPKRNRVKTLCRNELRTFDDALQVSDF